MPGPASSTSSTADAPSARSRTWTGWSAGDHLPALSMRLSTARRRPAGRPLTHTEVTSSATSMSGTREPARVAAATTTSARSSTSVLSSLTSPRARSVSSAARALNSATWAPRSLSSRVRLSAGSALSRVPRRSSRISSSTLRRRLVSGVLELVGGILGEQPLGLPGVPERGEHVVDRLDQPPDLPTALIRDVGVEIPGVRDAGHLDRAVARPQRVDEVAVLVAVVRLHQVGRRALRHAPGALADGGQ